MKKLFAIALTMALCLGLLIAATAVTAAVAEEGIEPIAPPQTVEVDGRTYVRFEAEIQLPLTSEGALNATQYALKNGQLRRNTVGGTTDLKGSLVGFTNQVWSQKGTRFSYETGAALTTLPAWGYCLEGQEIGTVIGATDDPYKSGRGVGNISRLFGQDVVSVSEPVAWMWVSEYPIQVYQFQPAADGNEAVNGFVLQGPKVLKSHINRTPVATTTEETEPSEPEDTDWTIGQPTDDQPDPEDDEPEPEQPDPQPEPEQTDPQPEPEQTDPDEDTDWTIGQPDPQPDPQPEPEQPEPEPENTDWSIGTSPSQDYGFGGQLDGFGFGI